MGRMGGTRSVGKTSLIVLVNQRHVRHIATDGSVNILYLLHKPRVASCLYQKDQAELLYQVQHHVRTYLH